MQEAQVWLLAGELRYHMSCSRKKQNTKHEQYYNKFNKDFKNSPYKKIFEKSNARNIIW